MAACSMVDNRLRYVASKSRKSPNSGGIAEVKPRPAVLSLAQRSSKPRRTCASTGSQAGGSNTATRKSARRICEPRATSSIPPPRASAPPAMTFNARSKSFVQRAMALARPCQPRRFPAEADLGSAPHVGAASRKSCGQTPRKMQPERRSSQPGHRRTRWASAQPQPQQPLRRSCHRA
jgi:hypothetical protein